MILFSWRVILVNSRFLDVLSSLVRMFNLIIGVHGFVLYFICCCLILYTSTVDTSCYNIRRPFFCSGDRHFWRLSPRWQRILSPYRGISQLKIWIYNTIPLDHDLTEITDFFLGYVTTVVSANIYPASLKFLLLEIQKLLS